MPAPTELGPATAPLRSSRRVAALPQPSESRTKTLKQTKINFGSFVHPQSNAPPLLDQPLAEKKKALPTETRRSTISPLTARRTKSTARLSSPAKLTSFVSPSTNLDDDLRPFKKQKIGTVLPSRGRGAPNPHEGEEAVLSKVTPERELKQQKKPAARGRPPKKKNLYSRKTGTTLNGGRTDSTALGRPSPTASANGASFSSEHNGIVPKEETKQRQRRALRSQAKGSRFKSDLALFFPNYDEVISNEPRSPDFLNCDTPLMVLDGDHPRALPSRPRQQTNQKLSRVSNGLSSRTPNGTKSLKTSVALSSDSHLISPSKLYNTSKLDFSSIEKSARQALQDPLDDEYYDKAHRKAERRERQLRNIEKNKAQHEKDNLERLLEGLKGPDWLKVMGITGITESEKKIYIPKRDFFISEVTALIEKFKAWREEEKRRKIEKGRDRAEGTAGEEGEGHDEGYDDDEEEEAEDENGSLQEPAEEDGNVSDGDPPDYSDVDLDAWAARQLHREAISAIGNRPLKTRLSESAQTANVQIATSQEPFVSFYSKPYLRVAAIGNHRRSGRGATAFGRPLPDLYDREFGLPADILTPEAVVASARKRRRLKRESKDSK